MAWFTCYHLLLTFKIRNIELQVSPDVTLSDAFLRVRVRYQNTFPAVMTSIKEDRRVGFGSVQFGLCLEQLWPKPALIWDISNRWYMLNRSPGTAQDSPSAVLNIRLKSLNWRTWSRIWHEMARDQSRITFNPTQRINHSNKWVSLWL